ncbi:hypothetical protein [Nocardia sp. BMG51109]|nr:hypothetical protein [Nocardia sp. BMG51109]
MQEIKIPLYHPARPEAVEWPEPSPLKSWWERVMFAQRDGGAPGDGEI